MEWGNFFRQPGKVVLLKVQKPDVWRPFLFLETTIFGRNFGFCVFEGRIPLVTQFVQRIWLPWHRTDTWLLSDSVLLLWRTGRPGAGWISTPRRCGWLSRCRRHTERICQLQWLLRFSLMNLKTEERDLLSPCASRRYATVRQANLTVPTAWLIFGLPFAGAVRRTVTEELFACQVLGSVGECAHRVIIVYIIVCDEVVDFPQVHGQPEPPN